MNNIKINDIIHLVEKKLDEGYSINKIHEIMASCGLYDETLENRQAILNSIYNHLYKMTD